MSNIVKRLITLALVVSCGCASTDEAPDAGEEDATDILFRDADTNQIVWEDGSVVICEGEADCPPSQMCVATVVNVGSGTCIRGTRAVGTQCRDVCGVACLVGPHANYDPNYPRGVVGGLGGPDCFDGGPRD